MDLAFDLLADMTLNANFPEHEFERERTEWISSLEASFGANPASVARPHLRDNRLYSSEHGYGNLYTTESLEAITRDDIVAFYESRRQPDNAVLIIAGAITTAGRSGLRRAALRRLGKATQKAISYPATCRNLSGQRILLVDRPGSTQATFRSSAISAFRAAAWITSRRA